VAERAGGRVRNLATTAYPPVDPPIIAIALPIVETGSDPTQIPVARSSGRWLPRCLRRSQAPSRACSVAAPVPADRARDTARVQVKVGQRRQSCLRYLTLSIRPQGSLCVTASEGAL